MSVDAWPLSNVGSAATAQNRHIAVAHGDHDGRARPVHTLKNATRVLTRATC